MSSQPHLSDNVLIALENAFQNPARNLTKVTVESSLECDACYHFDFTKDIIRFCSHDLPPVTNPILH